MSNNTKALAPIDQFKNRLEKSRDAIWKQKANWLSQEKSSWFERALVYISGESYLLQSMGSKEGQFAVLKCLMNACSLGLQFGGMYPQAYIVPFAGVPTLIPTAAGLKSIVLSNPAVVASINSSLIYTNDKCSIDLAAGQVVHSFDPIRHSGKRGDCVGGYAIVTDLKGYNHVTYMGLEDINRSRDMSPSWKKSKDGSVWGKFWPEMAEKTIIKKAVKPFLPMKDSRLQAIEEEDDRTVLNSDDLEAYQEMNISERVSMQMDQGAPPADPQQQEKEKPVITEGSGDRELFDAE